MTCTGGHADNIVIFGQVSFSCLLTATPSNGYNFVFVFILLIEVRLLNFFF